MVILLVALALCMVLPATALAQESGQTPVRVGWFDSSYNFFDQSGRRTGYSYEYQQKLSAYNGWTYEYVTGSWSDLLQMLKDGEIDLLSDVSYTAEREECMSFSFLPMGAEEYYLFTAPGKEEISPTEFSTLEGKRVGVNKGSYQADLYREWMERNGVTTEVIEVTTTEDETLRMLEEGEIDAYVTVDAFMDPTRAVPVYKIGSSDYYFAVSKSRPDLLDELNIAMSRIQDENRYYNYEMYEKFIRKAGANVFLSAEETDWLAGHGSIRVGFQDDYLAFCATDKDTGGLTGVLGDYLELAADCIPNVHLEFEAHAYPTAEAAIAGVANGEVDCAFPANLSDYEAESLGVVMTPPLLDTEMHAVVRTSDPNLFAEDRAVVVAVNEGNPNYEEFLLEYFPQWDKRYYANSEECLKGIAAGTSDCLIISNYRYNNIARLCDRYHLTSFSLGIQMDYCFAVEKGRTELYSILAKTTSMVPDAAVNAAVARYITQDATLTFVDYLEDNLSVVTGVVSAVLLVILVLLVLTVRANGRAERLISATEIDGLTGLYNREYFLQYVNQRYRNHKDAPMDAIVVDIEQFHSVNALHGRELGDSVLRAVGDELVTIADQERGIAGRFKGDRFDLYCPCTEGYQSILDRLQARVDEVAPNANICLRMGVMPWRKDLETVELFDRAGTACNMVRGHYREHLVVYDERVSEREEYEQRLVSDLRHALDAHEFEVFYQPKFDIQASPARLASSEALVRWHHPELGMIAPGDFVPLFEKNGQIRLLDRYVWAEAATQVAQWRDRYGMEIPVSVNLSRVDVFDPDLEDTLEENLTRNGLDHRVFKLEVTESAYTENADQVIRVVENLRKKGFEIEMDDFGTGYSSLNMLSALPIDALKMDREFIRNVDLDERNRQLVALIVGIAKSLMVPVIAEGVETDAQLQLLRSLGCELAQGYYFSRPLPAEEFESRFLRDVSAGDGA